MKKILLTSLFFILFSAIATIYPQITKAAILDFYFGSNNRIEIVYQVGFRIWYGCEKSGLTGCDGRTGTYLRNINGIYDPSWNRSRGGTINPLPGSPWQHVQWGTACVDPSVRLSEYDDPTNPGTEYTTGTINVTCQRYGPVMCGLTNAAENQFANQGGGVLYFNGYYNTANCPVYCARPSCVGRCGTFRDNCGLTQSVQVSCGGCGNFCGSNARACNWQIRQCNFATNYCYTSSQQFNDRSRCLGVNDCNCISNSDCTNRCGTGTYNACRWQVRQCNGDHDCFVASSARDSRCVAAPNTGTTGADCWNNSQCRTSTHYCRPLSSGSCGKCRPYDELQGRVFVDRNRNNEWNSAVDEGLQLANNGGAVRVQRSPTGSNNWRTTPQWEVNTNPNGWFAWDASYTLENINNQDLRIIPNQFGLYQPPTQCLYAPIIRSRYGGPGTVQTSPGHRRNNVDAEPNPTSVLFMLRHRPYEIRGRVFLDGGDGVFSADDTWLPNPTNVRVRTLDPDGSGNSGDWLSSSAWYRLPDAANSPPPQRFYVYGRTYQVELVDNTLPGNIEVLRSTNSDGVTFVDDPSTPAVNEAAFMDVTINPPVSDCINDPWDSGNNFLVGRSYNASGTVFHDIDGDGVQGSTAGENGLAGLDVDSNGNVGTTDANGDFSLIRLPEGTRDISITNLDSLTGIWEATYPEMAGVAPNLFPTTTISVGEPVATECDTSLYNNGLDTYRTNSGFTPQTGTASCITTGLFIGSVQGLAFGVRERPADPWLQGIGGDMRADSGLDIEIPTNSTVLPANEMFLSIGNGTSLEHGLVFGTGVDIRDGNGNTNTSGLANASQQFIDSVRYASNQKMTYSFINDNLSKNGITTTATGCSTPPGTCDISSLPIPATNQVYSSGSMQIGNSSPTPNTITLNNGGDYVILVNGDLEINDNILVNPGTTLFFIVSGSITVDEYVEDLQGVYSAGGQFIVNGNHVPGGPPTPPDNPLAIQGSVIGGTLVNNRDLDFNNDNQPPVSIEFRPDFVLNAPVLIRFSNYRISEVAPGDNSTN